jgi:hypothetical protein
MNEKNLRTGNIPSRLAKLSALYVGAVIAALIVTRNFLIIGFIMLTPSRSTSSCTSTGEYTFRSIHG